MTVTTTTPISDGNSTSGATSTADSKAEQITMSSQQLAERLARAKPADYDDLVTKAAELETLKAANLSEIDREKSRADKAEAEVTTIPTKVADALRVHLVKLHEISDEDSELFLTATDPDLLLKQVDRLMKRDSDSEADRKKKGNHVPREGANTPTPGDDPMREFARGLFKPGE